MHLSPKEIDKLMLHNAGFLAQKRYARGVCLNYVETIALISSQILEFIRDGNSVLDLMDKGKKLLGLSEVMPGVAEMVNQVQVEGTFPDGTKLVTVHFPVCREWGEEELALYGTGLARVRKPKEIEDEVTPGLVICEQEDIILNEGRESIKVEVLNNGDRPVQVGSHYPFFEVNTALKFNREITFGKRLDIPAGTAVRFEPGETKDINLIDIAGNKKVYGGNTFINGDISESNKKMALNKFKEALNG